METNKIILPQEIYSDHLESVNNVRLTRREIDIVAYLCGGRSAKTIASFLSITPKTIEAHMRNIMTKLECHSRDGIIDFIEKSDKFLFIKKYYVSLLAQACFERQLLKASQLIKPKNPSCLLIYWQNEKHSLLIVRTLEHHLKLAGIEVLSDPQGDSKFILNLTNDIEHWQTNHALCCFPYSLFKALKENGSSQQEAILKSLLKISENPKGIITLFSEKGAEATLDQEFQKINYINYSDQESFYSYVFLVLKKLLPDINLEEIILEFNNQCDAIYGSTKESIASIPAGAAVIRAGGLVAKTLPLFHSLSPLWQNRKMRFLIEGALCLGAFWIAYTILTRNRPELSQAHILHTKNAIRPDLAVPTQSTFLERPSLMKKIQESLEGTQEIQTVALIGTGGAGKTTLARYYARQNITNVTWEINAETKESLSNSFESFADTLAKTEEERRKLKELKDVKIPKERETKIISFVRDKIKNLPNWLLIYDNVEKFANIKESFPHDASVWGKGKVIILTRDKNIENNNNINKTVQVSELSPAEKLDLFTKIMANGNADKVSNTSLTQRDQILRFLSDIPPFPLDVSIAAYYLKITKLPYKAYLEKLVQYDKDFESVQQVLLEEASSYTKTRYGIITLSLQHIINSHKDFRDLLLFMSLLDSQNIPRNLLDKYKNSNVVDNFIYNLKKHSFVTSEALLSSGSSPTFSIHRSTQAIALAYISKLITSENNSPFIENIGKIFKNYVAEVIDKEDFTKMNLLIRHCEVFLNHRHLLTNFVVASIGSELGNIHRELGNYEKAKTLFEEGLEIYKKNAYQNHPWCAQTLGRLGCVYSGQGNYTKAKQLLEESLSTYSKNSYENNPWFARTLGWLGNVYREEGDYKKAQQLFEKSLTIYRNNSYENHPLFAQALGHLASMYREQCDYEKAKQLLEKSLAIYRKNSYENNPWFAKELAWLGNIYRELGQYKKAQQLLEESLAIYRKNYHENHPWCAWTLVWLGSLYREQGHYENAKRSLEESLIIYKKNNFENHPWFARALAGLGNVYREEGNYEKAKQFFEESLVIYKRNSYENHPWCARTLEQLGNIYKDLGNYEKAKQSLEESLVIYTKNNFENHPWFALVLARLGSVYKGLEDYSKAKNLLERSFQTYAKTCGKDHVDVAPVIMDLGSIHALEKDMDKAESLILEALKILQVKKPAESHLCLEILSDLSLKKASQLMKHEEEEQSKEFKNQALTYLQQALEVTKIHFPKESPHIARIEAKLKKLTQGIL